VSRGTAKDVAAIVASAGELVGRTRLQKTGSLLELTGTGFNFPYAYHLFGPYSDELVVATDRAVALGYIDEQEGRAKWGGKFTIYKAKQQQSSGDNARDALIAFARDADSVVLELAVTAAFLAANSEAKPWDEVCRRKAEKVTRARLSEAKALYKQFASVGVPRPLPNIV